MKQLYYITTFLLIFCSCQNKNRSNESLFQAENISTEGLQTITVEVEDYDFEYLGKYLKAASYVQLATEPLIGAIKEVQIKNEKIYVLDAFSRIVCYDMQGNVIFKIDAVGAGPGEYVRISAFAINEQSRELVIYDNPKTTLLYYNSDNGKHIKTEKFPKPNPGAMASSDGVYYYDNQFHSNYPNDSTLHYSLLLSKNGTDIVQRYFAHNQAEAEYHFSAAPQPFSYNDSVLYYCRNFDNTVYKLSPNGLKAVYEIKIPNPLPFSKIEEKANEMGLMKSAYSLGIECIYKCENLLYFQFYKGGYLQVVLYDLSRKKQIYCGKRLADKAGREVPFYRLINGVYKNRFWGYITPETIEWALANEPDKDYPEIFRSYNPDSGNPIIAFYEVVK
ncbi:6-bladed beta-propeller [uncultured Bacteroides sp.]|uniref:6-bladed beta-propeller n=1 Tax=uncultured Bacteroides sp. TaxID=162156 RepID=UPI002597A620|nr:6-bladed beta-propeller [uncultured Bacteroides sp.]